MGAHLIDGKFQSDKYPTCPRGFVPLKCTDKNAQPLLAIYANLHRSKDPEFSADLEEALRLAGYFGREGGLEAVLKNLLEERERLYEALTRVQTRCTELHDEKLELEKERDAIRSLWDGVEIAGKAHTCGALGPCDGSCPSGSK